MQVSIIGEKTLTFSKKIVKVYRLLLKNKEFVLSKQLLRSATSIGANTAEAIFAQSKRDFLSKLTIALKEAFETRYWLLLLQEERWAGIDYQVYLDDVLEIIKILTAITKKLKERLNGS